MTLTDLYNKIYLDILNKSVEDILSDILNDRFDTVKLSILDPKLAMFALHVPQRVAIESTSSVDVYRMINCGPESPFRVVLLNFYRKLGRWRYDGYDIIYQKPDTAVKNKEEELKYVKNKFFDFFRKKYGNMLLCL